MGPAYRALKYSKPRSALTHRGTDRPLTDGRSDSGTGMVLAYFLLPALSWSRRGYPTSTTRHMALVYSVPSVVCPSMIHDAAHGPRSREMDPRDPPAQPSSPPTLNCLPLGNTIHIRTELICPSISGPTLDLLCLSPPSCFMPICRPSCQRPVCFSLSSQHFAARLVAR